MQPQLLQTGAGLGGILSPKTFRFHGRWRCASSVRGQRVSPCPPAHPPCPAAALLSRGDLDDGGAVQPGRWQNPHLPFLQFMTPCLFAK